MTRFLPFLDLRRATVDDLRKDLQASIAVTLLSVPQGIAYAVIAGLPPVMGLYAVAVPAIIGGLFRSSRHVVVGPTNAISLLVGAAVASTTGDPVTAAATLALVAGIVQLAAGLLSLGALVDYISSSVVTGYITGAGILIGIGQLHHVTHTVVDDHGTTLVGQVLGWLPHLGESDPRTVAIALGTAAAILVMNRWTPRAPAGILVMLAGIATSVALDLGGIGIPLVRDLAPVPAGFPPLTVPDTTRVPALLSAGVAIAVLSLIESSAVARAAASKSGQHLDGSVDFAGQGLSNLAAAFFGGYPTSGSLTRSALNQQLGAQTRMGGVFSGIGMLLILLVAGPVVDLTPVATLAGVLLVVASKLVDLTTIRRIVRTGWNDRIAFGATVLGTFALPLDKAIFVGVGISLVVFLRQARLLQVRQLGIDRDGKLRERHEDDDDGFGFCPAIKVVHVEGSMFFGAASELRTALLAHAGDPSVKALIVRLRRARDLDYTTARALLSVHEHLEARGQALFLVGLTPSMLATLERTGIAAELGEDHLFPTRLTWFEAMNAALTAARELAVEGGCDVTRVDRYLRRAA